jgi:pilus assembly protein Flp/PilA
MNTGRKAGNPRLRFNRSFILLVNAPSTNHDLEFGPKHGAGDTRWKASTGVIAMRRLLTKFLGDESGATAIEYALIAMGIGVVIVTAVNGVGTNLGTTFVSVSTALK